MKVPYYNDQQLVAPEFCPLICCAKWHERVAGTTHERAQMHHASFGEFDLLCTDTASDTTGTAA